MIPPFIHKIIPYQKLSETQQDSTSKFFGKCQTDIVIKYHDTPILHKVCSQQFSETPRGSTQEIYLAEKDLLESFSDTHPKASQKFPQSTIGQHQKRPKHNKLPGKPKKVSVASLSVQCYRETKIFDNFW